MSKVHSYDLSVYLLQGGGALGSYQMGVIEGLLDGGCTPDWIVGTSIGAINAAIVAGNAPENRIAKLHEFWQTVTLPSMHTLSELIQSSYPFCAFANSNIRKLKNFWSALGTLHFGQPHFFEPRTLNPWFAELSTPDQISFYDTSQLKRTLEKIIDFDYLNQQHVRLSLSAVCLEDGELVCFDNTKQIIEPSHIMASGALPPGFAAVEIDGKHYWDGGINSNTPLSIVLEERIPQKVMCFLVNLFPNQQALPTSILEVLKRRKNLQYASQHHAALHSVCEIQRLQSAIHNICEKYKGKETSPLLKELSKLGHPSALNLVRFQYKDHPYDLFSKDYEFSHQSMKEDYESGLHDVKKALLNRSWLDLISDDAGVVFHEF